MQAKTYGFYVVSGNTNSGPDTCVANILPAEPFSTFLPKLFVKVLPTSVTSPEDKAFTVKVVLQSNTVVRVTFAFEITSYYVAQAD
jgi:Flp pilus assembly protein TadG